MKNIIDILFPVVSLDIVVANTKVVVKEDNNLINALMEFDARKIKSVVYTEGDITTFAVPVKKFRAYTLKTTGKYNNKTGEFEYV